MIFVDVARKGHTYAFLGYVLDLQAKNATAETKQLVYSVLTDYGSYFGPGHDWLRAFRVWDGGLGMPGAQAPNERLFAVMPWTMMMVRSGLV